MALDGYSPSLFWYLADGEGTYLSQWLWKLYRRRLKPLAGLTKLDRSQRRDQTKLNSWSSRLGVGVGLTTPPIKNKPVRHNSINEISSYKIGRCLWKQNRTNPLNDCKNIFIFYWPIMYLYLQLFIVPML